MKKKAIIIGAGISGLASASLLARDGFDVTVIDNHESVGGVARRRTIRGFTFDTGPTWYLMPGVFEHFFSLFGKKSSDYYELVDLDPSYKIFFNGLDPLEVDRDVKKTGAVFDGHERGAGKKLEEYLAISKYKHDVALREFLYREYRTVFDFFNRKLMLEGTRLHVFNNLERYTKRFFKNDLIRKMLHFNIVFIGCSPYDSPALYSLMSHVDLVEGVRYPRGGIFEFVDALHRLAVEQGASFVMNEPVTKIIVEKGKAVGVETARGPYRADLVLSSADYHHTETALLEEGQRNYSKRYWDKRAMAPSALILLLGTKKRVPGLAHHNLYLSDSWRGHFDTIFRKPAWPENPSYYVGCPSVTDPATAPAGGENIFVLVPVAPGLDDSDEMRNRLADWTIAHMEKMTGTQFSKDLAVKEIISHRDFISQNNLFKGTALGLAHTLFQTAVFRPAYRNKKVQNLYYTGHYTHPGIGMPMVLISSQVASGIIKKEQS